MSKVIRSVAIKIKAETSDFEKKMQAVQKSMKSTAKNLNNIGKDLTKYVTVPSLGAIAGVGTLVKKTAEYADNIDEMSQRTGLSIKTLQQLKYVSGQVGVEFENVESSFAKFTTTMKSALTSGGRPAELFEAMNIELERAGRLRPVSDLYMEAIQKIGNLSDETLQSMAANELFGRSFESIIPLMRMSGQELQAMMSKAERLGLVMGDKDVKAMGELNDKLTEVKQQFEAMGMRIATKFMPIVEEKLIPALEDKIIPFCIDLAEKIGDLITKFSELDPGMQKFIGICAGIGVTAGPALTFLSSVTTLLSQIPGLAKLAGVSLSGLGGAAGIVLPAAVTAAIVMPGAIEDYNKDLNKWKQQKATQDAKAAGQMRALTPAEKAIGVENLNNATPTNSWLAAKWEEQEQERKSPASYIKQYVREQTEAAKKQQAEIVKSTSDTEKALMNFFGVAEDGSDALKDKLEELRSTAKGFVDTIKEQTKAFANFTNLFDVFERKSVSGERLLNRLKAQVKAMGEWRNSLATLEKRGIGSEMISDLRSMGPGAVDSINALAKMSDAQLKEYTSLYGQKYGIAGSESSKLFSANQKAQTVIEKQVILNVTGSKQDAEAITNAIVKKLRLAGVNI